MTAPGDSSRIIAKRMILQIKPKINPEKINDLLKRVKGDSSKVVESGTVLSQALEFVVKVEFQMNAFF